MPKTSIGRPVVVVARAENTKVFVLWLNLLVEFVLFTTAVLGGGVKDKINHHRRIQAEIKATAIVSHSLNCTAPTKTHEKQPKTFMIVTGLAG